ncbi:hypothetical protein CERSUDRAFT_107500 [Gelatoporia subvermispora B]|uniref:Heterokaryon incompatibility domain-containing protein n=1 Tax=Ceriporiopsis subvermispora (strain B) TaxID=914234 RepID=M2PEI1_CERS8|nr:hypothetical protein CERSUDRAFT_107500 [Gelatoporia subvermispora B]
MRDTPASPKALNSSSASSAGSVREPKGENTGEDIQTASGGDHALTSTISTDGDPATSAEAELEIEFIDCYNKYVTLLPLAARNVSNEDLASKLSRTSSSMPALSKWSGPHMVLFILSTLRMLIIISTELSTQLGTVEGLAVDSGIDEDTFMDALQPDLDRNKTMQQLRVLNILRRKLMDFIFACCSGTQASQSGDLPFVPLSYDRSKVRSASGKARGREAALQMSHAVGGGSSTATALETTFLLAKDTLWLGGRTGRDILQPFPNFECGIRRTILYPAAVLQRKLTFELIQAVVGRPVPEDQLLRSTVDGTVVITTRHLPAVVLEWRERMDLLERTDRDAYKRQYAQARGALQATLRFLESNLHTGPLSPFRVARIRSDDITKIIFMIAAIGETLTLAMHDLRLQMLSARPLLWNIIAMASPVYDEEMAAEGWCPFTVNMLKTKVCVLGYASTCKPFIRHGAGRDYHRDCTATACKVNTMDVATYCNSHFAGTCTGERCVRSKPPLDIVVETLDRHEIPIMQIDIINARADGGLDITCSSSSCGTPYVAISHVWVDGLGSTTEDGLPTCELRRLATITHQLVKGGSLWLDALCIPNDKVRRKCAIGLMGETYRGASAVLVVDSGIRSCSVAAPPSEKLLRVMTSGWIQRLWTLQEASLAHNLVFEFSDGLLRVEDLTADISGASTPAMYELALRLKHIRRRSGPPKGGPDAVELQTPVLGDVITDVRWRTTSKAEDETLAIAGLLRIDASELVDVPPDKRMMALLTKVHKVPSNIIFMPEPHLSKPGFRWAPTTFMHSNSPGMFSDKDVAFCTEQGLVGTYHCITFDSITFRGDDEPWAIYGAANSPCFKLENVNTGVIVDASTKVTCNAILLGAVGKDGMISAAAVLADDAERGRAGERGVPLECTYVKTMIAFSMDEEGILLNGIHRMVNERWSGQLEVRLI